MDIEFIEQEHRDNIFKIMELCNCDMTQAYQLYNNNACNVEKAVQAKFNPWTQDTNNNQMNRNYQQNFDNNLSYGNQDYGANIGQNIGQNIHRPEISQDDDYQSYKIFKQSGMNFNKRYEVRRDNSGILKGMLSYLKSPENTFKKQFEEYIGRKTNLKIPPGSLSQCLQSVCKSKFPLVVHVLDFSSSSAVRDNIRNLYSDELFIETLNTQFQNYGINTKEYQLQPYLKDFINMNGDANCMIVFRISLIDEILLVSKISIGALTAQEIKKKLKQVKSNCIQIEMEELHLEKRLQEQHKGNFDYQKPMSLAEQRKLKEDRQIRKKQEEQFYAAMQPKKQQTKSSSNSNPQKSSSNGSSTVNKPATQSPKKLSKADIQSQRKKLRQSLRTYQQDGPGILAIKLRVPSSQHKKLYIHSDQPAQYLYDYISSREEDLGFEEDEMKRVFDIIEPYEKINLSERKNEKIGKIFEGENMLSLVVNQRVQ